MKAKLHRRWLERGKSLLIVLLTISALALLSQSPLIQGSNLRTLLSGSGDSSVGSTSVSTVLTSAAIPSRMAVGSDLGLYGVQYNQDAVDALFALAGPLLGEALSAAQAPSSIPQNQWRALLSGQCVYFDFICPVPLSSLCAWLKDGAGAETLTDSARYILLAAEDDGSLSLCYASENGGYFRCGTTLDAALHLNPIIESVSPNNAFFAFQDDSLPNVVAPYTLFTSEEISSRLYFSSTPAILSDSALSVQLLSALSFNDQNRASVSDGTLYVDGDDTLRLSNGGLVTYDASGTGKYAAGQGLPSAVDASWALAEAALSPFCGDARLYLISAQSGEEEGTYTVTFGYALNGSTVYLYDQGWAAQFQIQNGFISKFTLYLRSYTASEPQSLLPADKAAAALTALTDKPLELVIQYRDTGGVTAAPGWVGL